MNQMCGGTLPSNTINNPFNVSTNDFLAIFTLLETSWVDPLAIAMKLIVLPMTMFDNARHAMHCSLAMGI